MHEDLEQTQQRAKKLWDRARETPNIADEQKGSKLLNFIQILTCTIVGLLVFALAFFSKSSLLLLITLSNKKSNLVYSKPYVLLFISGLLVAPSVLMLLKCVWKIAFKDSTTPSLQTLIWVIFVNTLVAFGSSFLTLVTMPQFDVLTNVMLMNGVAILSALLQVIGSAMAHGKRRFIATSVASVILLLLSYCVFGVNYLLEENERQHMMLYVGLAILGTILVSLNWWENYATLFNIVFFNNTIRDIKKARNFVGIVSSLARIVVTFSILGVYVQISKQDWSSVWSVRPNSFIATLVLSLFLIQVISSALCRWLTVVACKMHAMRRSFLIPLILTSPVVLAAFCLAIFVPWDATKDTFAEYCHSFQRVESPPILPMNLLLTELKFSICNHTTYTNHTVGGFTLLGSSVISWWMGLVLCTLYIWFLNTQRIARTTDLFVHNLYESAFIDQDMLLNTKFEIVLPTRINREQEKVTIYLCATMWHETADEMMKMIISMFRIDKFRPKKNQFNDVSFEGHIFFDDAFVTKDDKRHVNQYAESLVEVIKRVYVIFTDKSNNLFDETTPLPAQKIMETPYGCRVQYILPHGNTVFVHMKDKSQIRHKKRWSQIMYMYYLLGWKLHKTYYQMFDEGDELPATIESQLSKAKENTYILALDGDIDFQPSAVMLLVDRLRLYPDVGAACGRIHPTGLGPMVWYQKFEYAVGHWLQKTAEHVFGCVLCSPGCFSLMRGAALLSNNVMKTYTTKSTEASHYLQYDQGEDRWLCTLILQQGWRVEYNAASDSYTNAPQEFKEFYNQRRRWGPSTMANTLDLLSSGEITAEKNKSISRPYILYQTITMAASILGPATVCLMIAGSFKFVFNMDANAALLLAIIPPVIYILLCFYLGHSKSDTQINIAAIMSIFYALLMTGTILSIVADMVKQETFMTPSGLFFIGMCIIYTVTAVLHPHECHLLIFGLLYIICIPSGYLLLAIYSMVNMNNVSWGTRESGTPAKQPTETLEKNVKCQKLCICCGYNLEFQINKEEQVMIPLNAPQAALADAPIEKETQQTSKPKKGKTAEPENCFIQQLQDHSGELSLVPLRLNDEEEKFWKDLIEEYLKPLETDKVQEEQIKKDLKGMRNKATFVFFICNVLWIVATFFLQAIGSSVSIRIPKVAANGSLVDNQFIFIDPIGLMFLISFASLLFIQFLAMLWHRVQTLIHFIAYTGTESVVNRKARKLSMQTIKEENNFL